MENEVYKLLEQLSIDYTKIEHPPLFSCEDNEKYNIKINALICKILFIHNSNKSQYYIVILPLEKKIDFKYIQNLLSETRLSFGDKKVLEEKLGIKTGSVSIFNIINQKYNDIIYILDKDILKYEKVGFHPNINTQTLIFDSKEIIKILEHYNVTYKFIAI